MDIKNLLCSHTDNSTVTSVTSPIKPAEHVIIDDDSYLYKSCYFSASSSMSSSPSSSYASPFPVLVSPPHSPSLKQPQQQRRLTTQTRTPWSSEEDFLLQKGYRQGLSWAMISSTYLPHRSRGCCWGRFKTLQAKALEQREWSDPEDRLLVLAIKKHSKLFKHAWKSVAEDMGQRNWRECEIRSFKLGSIIRKRHYQPHHQQHHLQSNAI